MRTTFLFANPSSMEWYCTVPLMPSCCYSCSINYDSFPSPCPVILSNLMQLCKSVWTYHWIPGWQRMEATERRQMKILYITPVWPWGKHPHKPNWRIFLPSSWEALLKDCQVMENKDSPRSGHGPEKVKVPWQLNQMWCLDGVLGQKRGMREKTKETWIKYGL